MRALEFLIFVCTSIGTVKPNESLFANPVLDSVITRASIIKLDNFYYMAIHSSPNTEITILRSQFLTDFRNAERRMIYKAPQGYIVYLTSILRHENSLYVYFCTKNETSTFQMYVIKSDNPFGQWSAPKRILENIWNEDSRNAAVLQTQNQLYFVWSSSLNGTISLYIAKMTNPLGIVNPMSLLREPKDEWECYGACINEAPSFIYNRNLIYMVFSASAPGSSNSSLSYMSISTGLDPLQASNWVSAQGPIFQGNFEENVYGITCPSFTTSPDGTETWMMYTSFSNLTNKGETSRARIEKIEWDQNNGLPRFPVARDNGFQQQLPSGESPKFANPIIEGVSSNPNAYLLDQLYYLVLGKANELVMYRSEKLHDFRDAENITIYRPPEGFSGFNTGRLLQINGDFYLYFHMRENNVRQYHMYVSKAKNNSDLLHNWETPILLLNNSFDASVLQHNEKLYFMWGVEGTTEFYQRSIYIAPMQSPTQVTEPFILLKGASECQQDFCSFDYPSILHSKQATFVVFSGSKINQTDSSLYYMYIENGRDPLDVMSWYSTLEPVFVRNDAEDVFHPMHASFTTSPDGTETWMLYQASDNVTGASPQSRIEKITWDQETGTPIFPKPHGFAHPQPVPSTFQYFTNPVHDESSASPDVVRIGSFYYMLLLLDEELVLLRSGKLTDFRNAGRKTVFALPNGYSNLGIGRMHQVNGQLYIYFSMEDSDGIQRMFVIQAEDHSNPMGNWAPNQIQLAPSWNSSAFHASILDHGENLYLTWVTPHPATGFNSIFIAKMENATKVVEPFVLIRHPTELWECDGGCSNEAPFFIYNEGIAYMVHSVGMSCIGGDALTYMSIGKGKDPLNVVDWEKAPGKMFSENPDENVFCPGHATFTVSPDGLETWMVYHATDSPHPDAIKTARIEKIYWNEKGELAFPEPHGAYQQQLVPGYEKFY